MTAAPVHRRIEHWHDEQAPKANSLVPASNLLVVNELGELLLQRRRDTGQWALPGGKQDIGESPSQCAVRECEEETGVRARVTGVLSRSEPSVAVGVELPELARPRRVLRCGLARRRSESEQTKGEYAHGTPPRAGTALSAIPKVEDAIDMPGDMPLL